MGLILDSSVLIAAERGGQNARQALTSLSSRIGSSDIAISVVTLLELAHGVVRADTPARKSTRQRFLQELQSAVPIHPVTIPMALRAGRLDGEYAAKGIRLALADLLIGVTALELNYDVATSNLRHFNLIPDLNVIAM